MLKKGEIVSHSFINLSRLNYSFLNSDSVNQYSVNVEHLKSLIDTLNNYNSKLTFEYKYFDAAAIASKM